jgi:DNA polymerase-3 subunit epsilon
MEKISILWLDTETTGLDENKHALIQIAGILDECGYVIDTFNVHIRPFKGDLLNKDALIKNGINKEDFYENKFLPPKLAFEKIISFLEKYINRYDSSDKLILAGKNIQFDIRFLRKFFDKCDDNYYGSWFHYPYIELESEIAKYLLLKNILLPNYKIETICEHFNIDIKAHDALEDVRATRKIYYKIMNEWINALK